MLIIAGISNEARKEFTIYAIISRNDFTCKKQLLYFKRRKYWKHVGIQIETLPVSVYR